LSIQLKSELGGVATNSGGLSSDVGVRGLNLGNTNCDPLLCAKVDGEYLKFWFEFLSGIIDSCDIPGRLVCTYLTCHHFAMV
jgi:hypothetical protein